MVTIWLESFDVPIGYWHIRDYPPIPCLASPRDTILGKSAPPKKKKAVLLLLLLIFCFSTG